MSDYCLNHFEFCRKTTFMLPLDICKDSGFLGKCKDPILTSVNANPYDVVYSSVQRVAVDAEKLTDLGNGERFGFGFLNIIPAMIVLDGNCITLSSSETNSRR
jgi:hypothetical protein